MSLLLYIISCWEDQKNFNRFKARMLEVYTEMNQSSIHNRKPEDLVYFFIILLAFEVLVKFNTNFVASNCKSLTCFPANNLNFEFLLF